MVSTLADLLNAILHRENDCLKASIVTHGPTVGDMYEGLTSEILSRTLPASAKIDVVSGFIRGKDKKLSKQIDTMVVFGKGERIPRTPLYIWDIENVIAVVEVKKSINKREMFDAYQKMKNVVEVVRNSKLEFTDAVEDELIKGVSAITGEY